MSKIIVWQFKFLSEGHFGPLPGSDNPLVVNLWPTKDQKHVFAKHTKWPPEVWFGLKIFWSLKKLLNFVSHWRSAKDGHCEIKNRWVMPVFIFSVFWPFLFWLSRVVIFESRLRSPKIFFGFIFLINQLYKTQGPFEKNFSFFFCLSYLPES